MAKVVAINATTIKEQEKLTPRSIILAIRTRVLTFKSFACSLSVSSSCFSRSCSSRNVGLSGFSILGWGPGVFRADFNGGDDGPFTFGCNAACCSTGSLEIYPNPTSDGWACEAAILGGLGGSANGDLCSMGAETGELTEVASAKRAVRAIFCDDVDEPEELEPVLADLPIPEVVPSSAESAKTTDCDPPFPLTVSSGETGSTVWFCG